MKFCPECGARLADEVVFCTDCGVYLIANNPVINEPVSQPVQPPEYVQQPQYIHPQQTTPWMTLIRLTLLIRASGGSVLFCRL